MLRFIFIVPKILMTSDSKENTFNSKAYLYICNSNFYVDFVRNGFYLSIGKQFYFPIRIQMLKSCYGTSNVTLTEYNLPLKSIDFNITSCGMSEWIHSSMLGEWRIKALFIKIYMFQAGEDPVVNQPLSVTLSFKNPLKRTLTNCKFRYEGPGLTKQTIISYR